MPVPFRPNVDRMSAYVPGEQPQQGGVVKLNTNENPYPPSPKVAEALLREIGAEGRSLRLYPDPEAKGLRRAAADAYGADPDEIICGNGSDDLLTMVGRAFLGEDSAAVFAYPTYSLYIIVCEIQGARAVTADYPRDFAYPKELARQRGEVLFVCNPNSPSGSMLAPPEVRDLARAFPGVVVVDEAYAEFSGTTCVPLIRELDNVIVLKTLSKSHSLAGMRLGLMFARKEAIAGIRKVKDSYNLDRLALAAGEAALRDAAWTRANCEKICATRARLISRLRGLGLETLDSFSNFVLTRLPEKRAEAAYRYLKERNIFVRYFRWRLLDDALRITVGTDAEIDAMLACLEQFLKE